MDSTARILLMTLDRDELAEGWTLGKQRIPIMDDMLPYLGLEYHQHRAAGFECHTLECPWANGANKQKENAILPGRYRVTLYSSPGLGYEVMLLHDVPGREYCEEHIANWVIRPEDGRRLLEGCIALGMSRIERMVPAALFRGEIEKEKGVDQSQIAFFTMRDLVRAAILAGYEVWLEIRNPPGG